jgi:hypothetical protein
MATVTESTSTVQMHHTLFADAVHQVSAIAHAKLPESLHGRLERATALVLGGGVFVEEDGSTQVRCTHGWYSVNGACPCPDHRRALDGLCKHRLAKAIYRRASEVQQEPQPQPSAVLNDAPAPLPEAPASVNVHLELAGRQIQLTLRDSDESRLLARLHAMLERFPVATKPTETTPQCPTHGAMKPSTKGKGWYCPRKLADGSWCKGK